MMKEAAKVLRKIWEENKGISERASGFHHFNSRIENSFSPT